MLDVVKPPISTKEAHMPSSNAKVTTDHKKIIKWAESRGAHPATVKGTSRSGAGVLRLDFPGRRGGGSLREISWDDFFDKFDSDNLAFLYQDKTSTGKISRFSKLIRRHASRAGARRREKTGSSKR